jgi:uncharacterized protein YbjQ (UPF0145 family)
MPMRRIRMPAVLVLLPLLAAGCASQPPQAPVAAAQVAVHESVASAPVRFQVIKRLWVDSWVSAFGTPSYEAQNAALEAFRQQAADLGGNGVINFGCYRKAEADAPLGCNGTVVRFQ